MRVQPSIEKEGIMIKEVMNESSVGDQLVNPLTLVSGYMCNCIISDPASSFTCIHDSNVYHFSHCCYYLFEYHRLKVSGVGNCVAV